MRAIWLVILVLLMAVTSTVGAAVRIAPAQVGNGGDGGIVLANTGVPATALDMKTMAGANLSEFVMVVLRKGEARPAPGIRNWRVVECGATLNQMPQRKLPGCLCYPMRN